MAPTTRPDYKINLDGLGTLNIGKTTSANTSGANSPIDAPAGSGLKYAFGGSFGSHNGAQAGPARAGTGSPSKEYGSRLFPKRAREIQAQEGLSPQVWGPPPTGSGHSTPLRETIPESPGSDSFPDFDATDATAGSGSNLLASNSTRRARAGTVPSRFPLTGSLNGSASSLLSTSNRVTPTSSPFQSNALLHDQQATAGASAFSQAALLSRLRAGSMPQRNGLLGGGISPFGSSVFSSNWLAGRERGSTLQSIRSSDGPSSPRLDSSPAENAVKTLDYLGLVDTPQSNLEMLLNQQQSGPTIADLAALNAYNRNTANRFRSYSVNAKEKYADGDDDDLDQYDTPSQLYSGQLTPSAESAAAQAAAIHEAVRQHNLEVQAFANFASANRPRARTAGVLDSPSSRVLRNYLPTPSRLENSITAADLQSNDGSDMAGLTNAMSAMQMNPNAAFDAGLDSGLEAPTRSLWLGNVPSSATVSSLNMVFGQFGPIEFARILTHKSCGFVNFENVHSAIAAKAQLNGKELFPGCGAVRIGYAKEQSASNTPGATGGYTSPSPDPFVSKARNEGILTGGAAQSAGNINAETEAAALTSPNLLELKEELLSIVQQFGATGEDQQRISSNLETAMSFHGYALEVPPIPEPSHNRVHDAPRLREIRKRIDNNSCSPMEIENIAMEMIPEIAELASDYLGNTVVQKLFEHCSEETKEAMLLEIGPHLAEIGVHKNGTWAAQKIIDVAHTQTQMQTIVDALRPHAVNLFLDQYGNYVMQCCLRFQSPLNNFIFETMINRLWDVAQGRFGARAMRACLESHFATNDQKRLMAAVIALHSVQLATNSNGALLLTWFLDTCTFPRRRSVLAPRLIPHLVHLCTHKVAYLTVLKIINQRNEPEARDTILKALFFDEQTLNDIINDQACGATLIFKVLTTPFLDDSLRPECVEAVRSALLRMKAQPGQGYKRLMDEVGLSTRHGGGGTPVNDGRSNSKTRQANGHLAHLDGGVPNGFARPPYSGLTPQQQPAGGFQRNPSVDPSNTYDPFTNGLVTPQYTHSPALSNAGISPQQVQYQQALLAAQAQAQSQMQQQRAPPFYGSPMAPPPQANVNGMPYGAASPGGPPAPHGGQMLDPYRQSMGGIAPGMGMGMNMSPAAAAAYQQGAFVGNHGGMMGGGVGGYPAPPQFPMGYYQQGQMAGQGRRGRR